jgi:hypothetical protein
LRAELSELFELLTFIFLLRSGTFDGVDGLKYRLEKRSRIRLLINCIRLRLNPEEEPSQRLLEAINTLRPIADNGALSDDAEPQFNRWMEAAVSLSQEILKTEWKRVKKGR